MKEVPTLEEFVEAYQSLRGGTPEDAAKVYFYLTQEEGRTDEPTAPARVSGEPQQERENREDERDPKLQAKPPPPIYGRGFPFSPAFRARCPQGFRGVASQFFRAVIHDRRRKTVSTVWAGRPCFSWCSHVLASLRLACLLTSSLITCIIHVDRFWNPLSRAAICKISFSSRDTSER